MQEFPKRKAIRLKGYDYSKAGYYYVTICTYNHKELFGQIKGDCMVLNEYGVIVRKAWQEIACHCPNVELDEYIVWRLQLDKKIIINSPLRNGHARPVNQNKKNNNLSVIIGSFKSAVSRQINKLNNNSFKWQRFFYDHHIRTEESLKNIREYIINNPAKWADDNENIINLKSPNREPDMILTGRACPAPTGQFY